MSLRTIGIILQVIAILLAIDLLYSATHKLKQTMRELYIRGFVEGFEVGRDCTLNILREKENHERQLREMASLAN